MSTLIVTGGSIWIHKVKDSVQRRDRSKKNNGRISCSMNIDPYETLRIERGASESDVKKAFRQLTLKYHPDVCKGGDCGVQFHNINEAYDIVMTTFREESNMSETGRHYEPYDAGVDEPLMGMNDPDWDMWEEWMGWEGAGIRDYSSHINPYI